MNRQICWTERLEDRVKREVRVTVIQGSVKWQFKRSDEERWDYDSPPSAADWETLLEHAENRYRRRTCSHKDLDLIRRSCPSAPPRQPG